VLASDWYRARLEAKQRVDTRLWERHADYLEKFLKNANYSAEADRLGLRSRLEHAWSKLRDVRGEGYADSLRGMTGVEPAIGEARGRFA